MLLHRTTLFTGSLLMLGLFLGGCLPLKGTPALQAELVYGTLTAKPPATPTELPDRSEELSCSQGSDCVLAYRTDQCCSCWSIYNQDTVDADRHLRLLNEPSGYKYAKWRCPSKVCPFIACAPCFNPPYGLVCDGGLCRGVETWQENLNACRDLPPEKQGYCLGNAAVIAYQTDGTEQAASVCNSLAGMETWGTPFSEECLLQVARLMMTDDPHSAVLFCRSYATILQSNCLNETAFAMGKTDLPAALAVCDGIQVNGTNDIQQKNFCFHNLAMSIAVSDLAKARQICERVSQGVEQCRLEAEQVGK